MKVRFCLFMIALNFQRWLYLGIILCLICTFVYSPLVGQRPIDTTRAFTIGGIKQFVQIKGRDRSKPLLLFLHGGPGNSVMGYSEKFTKKLQQHFTVVQWDQRESGKTKALNSSLQPLSTDLFKNDTRELIDSLLVEFEQPKLYLLGHSWGTYLGFYIANHYPELLYAYVPICPMVNQLESERLGLEMMTRRAKEEGNEQAIKELGVVKIPFENGEQLYYNRKWLLHFNGSRIRLTKNYVESWSATWLPVFNDASKDNLLESSTSIKCPIYFFIGRNDYQTNSKITEAYYEKLTAPKKGLYWFERSGHSVPSSEPGLMQDILIEKILPETY